MDSAIHIQPGLGIPEAVQADPADVEEFVALLAGRGWMKAPDVVARREGWTARYVRVLCNASAGRVISGTSGEASGYKLTREATLAEIQRCEDSLLHRCQEMTRRVIEIRKARQVRVPPPSVPSAPSIPSGPVEHPVQSTVTA